MIYSVPRILAAVVVAVVLAVGGGFLWLGTHVTPPAQTRVHRDLPPDRFAVAPAPIPASMPVPAVPAAAPLVATPSVPVPATPVPAAHP